MITNNFFKENRNKSLALLEKCVTGHDCEMPLILEYVALNVFMYKVFKRCLFEYSYACTSEHASGYRFIVGGIHLDERPSRSLLRVSDFPYKALPNGADHYVAGGRRKLQAFTPL
jgi:hypothetical protein